MDRADAIYGLFPLVSSIYYSEEMEQEMSLKTTPPSVILCFHPPFACIIRTSRELLLNTAALVMKLTILRIGLLHITPQVSGVIPARLTQTAREIVCSTMGNRRHLSPRQR